MFAPDQYQLLDFGEGRKLERFGPYVLDRPSPASASLKRADPGLWKSAHARYERTSKIGGQWRPASALPRDWVIRHGSIRLQLKATEFGHLGVFAEQAENWDWITKQIHRVKTDRRLQVLNLFAYTGGSTLAAAAAGADVVHVDAASNIIAWARRNAALSDLDQAPVRWICEDVRKFVQRELRRGNHYDAVILDPPSYGHGPKSGTWRINQHLMPLLSACGQLTSRQRAFILLTCHSPGFGPAELQACLAEAVFGHCRSGAAGKPLLLRAADGRCLPCGAMARWPS